MIAKRMTEYHYSPRRRGKQHALAPLDDFYKRFPNLHFKWPPRFNPSKAISRFVNTFSTIDPGRLCAKRNPVAFDESLHLPTRVGFKKKPTYLTVRGRLLHRRKRCARGTLIHPCPDLTNPWHASCFQCWHPSSRPGCRGSSLPGTAYPPDSKPPGSVPVPAPEG